MTEPIPHKRRPRYRGSHPRAFHEKYKELDPAKYPEEAQKVMASGKTPAGAHRPIMVGEILEALNPQPGETAVDATLGYGGHARAVLARVRPGGRLIGLDTDSMELPKTEARLRAEGFDEQCFTACQGNFAGLARVLPGLGVVGGVDLILADLGCSSMQFDNPERGFSFKHEAPLDMRMNPKKGRPASALLASLTEEALRDLLVGNSDEPLALQIAAVVAREQARRPIETTGQLAAAVRSVLRELPRQVREAEGDKPVRRVFQALRIAVNDEFGVLQAFLSFLPGCLRAGGRVAILTFHSGEDRRVKQAFEEGQRSGLYQKVSDGVVRASSAEVSGNPRASSAKLRWAVRSAAEFTGP